MQDVEGLRVKAGEFSRQAREAPSPTERERLLRMEYSYLLLAKNAEWLRETESFLREQRRRLWSRSNDDAPPTRF